MATPVEMSTPAPATVDGTSGFNLKESTMRIRNRILQTTCLAQMAVLIAIFVSPEPIFAESQNQDRIKLVDGRLVDSLLKTQSSDQKCFQIIRETGTILSFTFDDGMRIFPEAVEGIKEGAYLGVKYKSKEEEKEEKDSTCDDPNGEALEVQLNPDRGILRNEFTFGFQISAEDGRFSERDPILMFSSDTLFHPWERSRIHGFFNLNLTAIGSEEQEDDPSSLDTFVASRKTLQLDLGLYWVRELRRGENVINVGVVLFRLGFQTITEDVDDGAADSASAALRDDLDLYGAMGFRIAHHKRVPRSVNPEISSSLEILGGFYGNFLSKGELSGLGVEDPQDHRRRLVVDGRIRFPGTLPLYLGIIANIGRGPDDIRIYAALKLDVGKLTALVPQP